MGIDYPMGPALTFTPDEDVDMTFTPASISKSDARQIGLAFCEASDPEREALLDALDPKMVRRSLLVFANTAARVGDPAAAAFARDLRSQIAVVRARAAS